MWGNVDVENNFQKHAVGSFAMTTESISDAICKNLCFGKLFFFGGSNDLLHTLEYLNRGATCKH